MRSIPAASPLLLFLLCPSCTSCPGPDLSYVDLVGLTRSAYPGHSVQLRELTAAPGNRLLVSASIESEADSLAPAKTCVLEFGASPSGEWQLLRQVRGLDDSQGEALGSGLPSRLEFRGLDLCPAGKLLACALGSGGKIAILDYASGETLQVLDPWPRAAEDEVLWVRWVDERTLYAGHPKRIGAISVPGGQQLWSRELGWGYPACSPKARFVSLAGRDQAFRVLDAKTGEEVLGSARDLPDTSSLHGFVSDDGRYAFVGENEPKVFLFDCRIAPDTADWSFEGPAASGFAGGRFLAGGRQAVVVWRDGLDLIDAGQRQLLRRVLRPAAVNEGWWGTAGISAELQDPRRVVFKADPFLLVLRVPE